jgi:hypothetical protein
MPDPTGARMRTMNSFFDSPRFPIKALPERDGHDHDDDDHDAHDSQYDLPAWNAYVGSPR